MIRWIWGRRSATPPCGHVYAVGFQILLLARPCAVGAVPLIFDTSFVCIGNTITSSVAVIDVNHDGFPDLIGSHRLGNALRVVLNNGDGTFPPSTSYYPTLQEPTDLAVGDLNLDGKVDLGLCNYGSNTVSVYLGNGDGTFTVKSNFQPCGPQPLALAFGLLNNDAILDLAVTNLGDNTLTVAFGLGDGTFAPQTAYATGNGPYDLALGDLNNDLLTDIVTANSYANTFSVFLNNGDGTFGARQDGSSAYLRDVAIEDFDGDGNQDLALCRQSSHGVVSVLWGAGNGTFPTSVDYAVGDLSMFIATADLDGDGRKDIVTTNKGVLLSSFTVLSGQANRQFGNRQDWSTGNGPEDVAISDVDQDGSPDVVVASGSGIAVSLNRGAAAFGGHVPLTVQQFPYSVLSVDMNRDGKTDVVAGTDFGVSVLLQDSAESFVKRGDYGSYGFAMATGDFNEDGAMDLVAVGGSRANAVSVLLGTGDGALELGTQLLVGQTPYSVAVADLDYDGHLDFAVPQKGSDLLSVMYGDGSGTAFSRIDYPAGSRPTCVGVGDVNGDGVPDLVVGDSGDPKAMSVFIGRGELGFSGAVAYPAGISPEALALGDLNGDGCLDLAVGNRGEGSISIHLGTGTGSFPSLTRYIVSAFVTSVAIGDMDGDGFLDVVAGRDLSSAQYVSVLLGNGDGSFGQRIDYGTGLGPRSVSLRDLNGDHRLDILTANRPPGGPNPPCTISILMNTGGVPVTSVPEDARDGGPRALLTLGQNYPNPLQSWTVLPFSLARPGFVRSWIYDPLGRLVARRNEGSQSLGVHHLTWDGRDDSGQRVEPGVYFIRLEMAGEAQTRKVIVGH